MKKLKEDMVKKHVMLLCTAILLPIFCCSVANNTDILIKSGHKPVLEECGSKILPFTENRGQWDDRVLFRSNANGTTLWFTENEIYYQFVKRIYQNQLKDEEQRDPFSEYLAPRVEDYGQLVLKTSFVGAALSPNIIGESPLEFKFHYLIGNDPSAWRRDVSNYQAVRYKDIYSGIDLKFYGNGDMLEYDFVIAPGADPSQIKVQLDGIESLSVNASGQLLVETEWGTLIEQKPAVYQIKNGKRTAIDARYLLLSENSFGFMLGEDYDPDLETVIDPAVVMKYSTFVGGGNLDESRGVDVDRYYRAYICGSTLSPDFPVHAGFDESFNGNYDVFVSKFTSDGSKLMYSTFLGGSDDDQGYDIAVDSNEYMYITGKTYSSDFPTSEAVYPTHGGNWDAFAAKITPDGSDLKFCTYLGGPGGEFGRGICLDPRPISSVYLTGITSSGNFPTKNAYQDHLNGGMDAFITIFTNDGQIDLSTFIGGSGYDSGEDIVCTWDYIVAITGRTSSTDFPIGLHTYDNSYNGGSFDAYIARISSSTLNFSTYIGGDDEDIGYAITMDDDRQMYVTGYTESKDFPTHNAEDPSFNGGADAFVMKFATGGTLLYSTFLGGVLTDIGYGIATNYQHDIFVTGVTSSPDFPIQTAYDETFGGGSDVFLTRYFLSGVLTSSSYYGGDGYDTGYDIKLLDWFDAFITGTTNSPDFPVKNAFDDTYNGGDRDAFLFRYGER